MSAHSDIQWCDSTVNASSGCVGCELARPSLSEDDRVCWAYQLHTNRLSKAFAQSHPHLYSPNFFEVRQIPGRIAKAAAWPVMTPRRHDKPWIPTDYPRLIFLSDMADLLSPQIPFEYIRDEVLAHVTSPKGARHIWLWLTKQAKRLDVLNRWLEEQGIAWPANLWPGVSVTNAETAWRVSYLMRVPAAVRFVSYEPAYEWVDFFDRDFVPEWIIVGGASGLNAKPFDLGFVDRLLQQQRRYGKSKIFVKQLGAKAGDVMDASRQVTAYRHFRDGHGGDWNEWPKQLRVREFPEIRT